MENMVMSESKIRSLYGEFIGYLSEFPDYSSEVPGANIDKRTIEGINASIDQLISITEDSEYDKFKIGAETYSNNSYDETVYIFSSSFRIKLGGLISKIHGTYYPEQPSPFSNGPLMVIQQNQTQSQNLSVEISHVIAKIDEVRNLDSRTKDEQKFLDRFKEAILKIRNNIELLQTALSIAKGVGLSSSSLYELLKAINVL